MILVVTDVATTKTKKQVKRMIFFIYFFKIKLNIQPKIKVIKTNVSKESTCFHSFEQIMEGGGSGVKVISDVLQGGNKETRIDFPFHVSWQ